MPRCKICKSKFIQKRALQPVCDTYECKVAYALNVAEKSKQRKIKQEEDINLLFKEKAENKKLTYLLNNVKNLCHEYIRLRDKNLPCISCNNQWNIDFQAGHFYKAELYSNLKFDENNISGQCRNCNLRKDGNVSGYRAGIIQRYGEEHLKQLDDIAKEFKQSNYKWDREELETLRKHYKEKIKELKH
jgi:hypothetical protein